MVEHTNASQRRALSDAEQSKLHEFKSQLSAKGAEFIDKHPDLAIDDRRRAKAIAGHLDALADGKKPDTPEYFDHIAKHCGLPTGRNIRVLADGKRSDPHDPNQMTRGEYRAATETVLWGREGGDKCGEPIGVQEYLRRRDAQRSQPGWHDKLD
jgi:hypothetical protein